MALRAIILAVGTAALTVALIGGGDARPWFLLVFLCFSGLLALDSRRIRSRLPNPPFEVALDRLYRSGKQSQDDVINSADPAITVKDAVLGRIAAWDKQMGKSLSSLGARGDIERQTSSRCCMPSLLELIWLAVREVGRRRLSKVDDSRCIHTNENVANRVRAPGLGNGRGDTGSSDRDSQRPRNDRVSGSRAAWFAPWRQRICSRVQTRQQASRRGRHGERDGCRRFIARQERPDIVSSRTSHGHDGQKPSGQRSSPTATTCQRGAVNGVRCLPSAQLEAMLSV